MPGPDPEAVPVNPRTRGWITLITRAMYLPGVLMLVHTLHKHKSKHTIIVQYTAALQSECIQCLENLLELYPRMCLQKVEPVALPGGLIPIAARFDDTLTKLRAFQPLDQQGPIKPSLEKVPSQVCFLDADIMVFRNLDDIFDVPRSADWIAAHHACICNVDSDPWAPADWHPDNCATSAVSHPEALNAPIPSSAEDGARPTYQRLNSGVFCCTPSPDLWDRMEYFRTHDERVKTFTFPDQNFLDAFFENRWVPIGWQYNAFKTHRYWHAPAWRDDEVRALHYIVDKPWEARLREDGSAGYLGRDGVTHSWWWKEYEEWEAWIVAQQSSSAELVLTCTRKHICVDSELGKTRYPKE